VTRIIAVGYAEEVCIPRQPRMHAFPHALERDDLERLADLAAGDLANDRAVVAIYPSWLPESTLRRLQTVRSLLGSPRFALHASDAPPVAGSVLCALAAAAAAELRDAGLLYAGLPVLERQIAAVAQLPSVTRLRHPTPSLLQHVTSWWPRSSFAVSFWPRPQVAAFRRGQAAVALPRADAWEGLALDTVAVAPVPPSGAPGSWFEETVIPALGASYLLPLEVPPLSATYWSTPRVVEAAAYPSDTARVVRLLSGAVPTPCPFCGERVASQPCPFCHAASPPQLAGAR